MISTIFSSKIAVVVISFIVLILIREFWWIGMAFYGTRQVRQILMDCWYQWSIHGNRLPMMKRLGMLFSIISLYEESGVEILPGLLDQEEIANFMDESRGMSEEELIEVTDRIFNRISEIRNEGAVVA